MAWLVRKAHEMGVVRSVALAIAITWCGVLIVGAFAVPVYSTSGSAGTGTDTLVGANGTAIVAPLMIPLALVVIVADLLWRQRFSPRAGAIAWVITGLMAVFNLLAMLTIGIFVLPITTSLVVACASSSSGSVGVTDYRASWKT